MSRAPWNNVFLTGRWSPPSGRLQMHQWPLGGAKCNMLIIGGILVVEISRSPNLDIDL